jgi:pimeloyl-ACP methyl ester carboxylesterase
MPSMFPSFFALLLSAWSSPGGHSQEAVSLTRTPVEHTRADGTIARAERCRLRVPIVRANPDSRPIEIDVWRFLAREGAPDDAPAIYELQGGPGWPGVEEREIDWDGQVALMTRVADLVFVGQRGIGTSTDLPCDDGIVGPATLPDGPFDRAAVARRIRERSARCREHWDAQGYDTRGLNVRESAADVADVARLLGHERIQLVGGSFGSHWSMAILRFHSELVARAVLNGMEGPDHTYDSPGGVLAALERLAAAAESAPELADQIPEGGLIAALREVIEAVEAEPFDVEVDDPDTGEPVTVRLDGDALRDVALGVTARVGSRRGMATWPADVLKLHRGEFEDAARAVLAYQRNALRLSGAAFHGLDCGSGITPERLARYQADPAIAIVGDLSAYYEAACPPWGTDLGNDFREGFRTAVPTVIVHGLWDVNTPFENALECLPLFEHATFIPVDGGSHGAFGEAIREAPGFRDAFLEFLATGSTEDLPDEIALPPIRWAVPR